MLSNSHLKNIHILVHSDTQAKLFWGLSLNGSMEKIKRDSAYLSSSGHDRFPSKQFRKNTTSTPQVNCRAVLCYTEQKLGGPIPKRHNPASQLLPLIRVKKCSKTKICYFKYAIIVNQKIRAFNISMQNPSAVAVVEPTKQLLHITLNLQMKLARMNKWKGEIFFF